MTNHTSEEKKGPQEGKFQGQQTPDWDELVNGAVRVGTGLGSTVLSGLSEALEWVGERLESARTPERELPFAQWKRRLDRRLQNKQQSEATALAVTGWIFAGSFGIAAIVMWALSAAGPEALGITREQFLVFPILMGCFTPLAVGFGIMGGVGVRKYRYIRRLRCYLRLARSWVCDLPALARDSAVPQERVQKDLAQAVAQGDFPDAVLEPDGKLYLDTGRLAPQPPEPAPQTERAPEMDDATALQQEGAAFLDYLARVDGKLGADAAEELVQMRKNCAAILGFVHNHPEQLPRIRRFREYYLPTTQKLLDTAQGLVDTDVQHAQEIRRDITGILHTLNLAYSKLYDTLLQDVSLDVSTEIDTLETMLRQDGLTHDFESDFKNGSSLSR